MRREWVGNALEGRAVGGLISSLLQLLLPHTSFLTGSDLGSPFISSVIHFVRSDDYFSCSDNDYLRLARH